ncbi:MULTISPECIES: helix-turn-helix domain-containing protein [unclassified Lysinibacillus]|uniref:helix-turn-helix domain-containing protein n=1 Tax=unclassified Lysinibacillus TaxID=2636778 RepID=UPI00131F4287|nr:MULTISPECIES: Rgg/GadR/MutR family transcriptional regulator [unclassified Lysinibacillus]
MKNLGNTFRKLRLHKGYNLSNTARDIISVSHLSKFERDETDITVSKLLLLLNRINISFKEFIYINNEFKVDHFEELIVNMRKSYLSGDLKFLNKLRKDEISKFELTNLLSYKLNSIMIEAITSDLTHNKIEQANLKTLIDYLWQVEIWGEYEIILYGNTLHILDIDAVIMLSSEVIKKSIYFKNMLSYKRDLFGIYFNTIRICLEHNKLKEAEAYLYELKNQNIPETFILEKIILNFYFGIFKMHTQYKQGLELAQESIYILHKVESLNHALNYEEYLQSYIKKLENE